MERLKNADKKGISTKRKMGKTTYEPIIIFYSMKIKEQSRKRAVGYSFEVADKTDEVSNIHTTRWSWRGLKRFSKSIKTKQS